jgi:hypothetical protein
MVVVGADVHKRTHTFVAVDEVGKRLAEFTVLIRRAMPRLCSGLGRCSPVSGGGVLRTVGIFRPGWSGSAHWWRAGGAGAAEADGADPGQCPDPWQV